MEIKKKYIHLKDLEVYKLSRELSKIGWEIYKNMDWRTKKVVGDQLITSLDSIGANITEGYSRYHYLDQIKFYYNARGSLSESCSHWLELLKERELIKEEDFKKMKSISEKLSLKLNNFISSTYKARKYQQ
ncbi:four helix bundle protein [bacterium]|nr:four helix bundle protein [bacterium]